MVNIVKTSMISMCLLIGYTHTNQPKLLGGENNLMRAAADSSEQLVCELIGKGEEVNAVLGYEFPHAGRPVLRYAIDSGSRKTISILIKAGALVNVFTESPFIHKTRRQANVRNLPLLSHAIHIHASPEIIKDLIDAGAQVNKESMFGGWTPLMIATYTGYSQAIRILLRAGANPAIPNDIDDNRIALDYAKENKLTEIIALLNNSAACHP